jgi:hypothetical protein
MAVTRHAGQPAQYPNRAATLAQTAALARRQVLLNRRQQEAVAGARAICHRARLQRARQQVRRQRHHGIGVGPLAWFAVQGMIDDEVVRAIWTGGRLTCDRRLATRARLLVDLGAEFRSVDPPRRYHASLQAPTAAVLLTLIRSCDLTTVIEVDLGDPSDPTW